MPHPAGTGMHTPTFHHGAPARARERPRPFRQLIVSTVIAALALAGCSSHSVHVSTAATNSGAAPGTSGSTAPSLDDGSSCTDWVKASAADQLAYAASVTGTGPGSAAALAFILNHECQAVAAYPNGTAPSTSSIGIIAAQFNNRALLASTNVCDQTNSDYVAAYCTASKSATGSTGTSGSGATTGPTGGTGTGSTGSTGPTGGTGGSSTGSTGGGSTGSTGTLGST